MKNNKYKFLKGHFIVVLIILAVLLIAGGTYSLWLWTSNINKNVVFNTITGLEDYIIYDEGESYFVGNFQPTDTFCKNVSNSLSFKKTSKAANLNLIATIYMDINSIGVNISKSDDVYWVITSGDKNINCVSGLEGENVLGYGVFNGVKPGDRIKLLERIYVTEEVKSYTVWIWIDSNGTDLSKLSGETIDANVWTEFEMYDDDGLEVVVNFDVNGENFDNAPSGGIVYNTPGEHEFVVPYDGEYKLEVWGAQGGGTSSYIGGYGGYSVGVVNLTDNQTLFVNVGGGGNANLTTGTIGYIAGGYNGGGDGTYAGDGTTYSATGGSGGGATHVAIVSGELSTLSDNQNSILIVAGGGGGAGIDAYESYMYSCAGGSAGGYQGTVVSGESTSCSAGTQLSGNLFGIGGNYATATHGAAGGGGGYYGGGGGGVNAPGCGGSGYIVNSLLTNKYMYCYNRATSDEESTRTYTTTDVSTDPIANYAKSGDGAARITLISIPTIEKVLTYGQIYGELPKPTRDGYAFLGWYTKDGIKVTKDTVMNNKVDHTLYARWTDEYSMVTLNAGAGSFDDISYTTVGQHEFTVPYDGEYQLEVWGAQGGSVDGYGAYTSGIINLNSGEKLYIYVGGKGSDRSVRTGGYNGGGTGGYGTGNSSGGGGASDIRYFGIYMPSSDDLVWSSSLGLRSRIMVAAGGATQYSHDSPGTLGAAGGLISDNGRYAGGATQTAGGSAQSGASSGTTSGSFGIGGNGGAGGDWGGGGAGGGGYYGGSGGSGHAGGNQYYSGGTGGSSYISGHKGCVAITSESSSSPKSGCSTGIDDISCSIHYSNKIFSDTVMIGGNGYVWSNVKGSLQQMPNPNGGYYGSGVGHSGDGVVKISQLFTFKKIVFGETYGELHVPTREGYTFLGWYTEKEGGTQITSDMIVSDVGNQTLYAHWQAN